MPYICKTLIRMFLVHSLLDQAALKIFSDFSDLNFCVIDLEVKQIISNKLQLRSKDLIL